ncbi:MAG: alpha-1,2-mannosidase, partial [Bacteroidetes bacterium]|nr:alpha-1,2-mannosidase [Bacteroidota bacterium]
MKKNNLLTISLGGLIILSLYSCSYSESSSGKTTTARQGLTGKKKSGPVDYVNPFIGTQYFGHTFPGASLPYAMVHVSPNCNNTGW